MWERAVDSTVTGIAQWKGICDGVHGVEHGTVGNTYTILRKIVATGDNIYIWGGGYLAHCLTVRYSLDSRNTQNKRLEGTSRAARCA